MFTLLSTLVKHYHASFLSVAQGDHSWAVCVVTYLTYIGNHRMLGHSTGHLVRPSVTRTNIDIKRLCIRNKHILFFIDIYLYFNIIC